MIKKHHIHLVKNGRISMAGINSKNVNYIADAIKDAVDNSKWDNNLGSDLFVYQQYFKYYFSKVIISKVFKHNLDLVK